MSRNQATLDNLLEPEPPEIRDLRLRERREG